MESAWFLRNQKRLQLDRHKQELHNSQSDRTKIIPVYSSLAISQNSVAYSILRPTNRLKKRDQLLR